VDGENASVFAASDKAESFTEDATVVAVEIKGPYRKSK
jgi:hypothetical protein